MTLVPQAAPDLLKDPLILAAPPRIALPALCAALAEGYGLHGALEPLGGERDRNFCLTRAQDGRHFLVKVAHAAEDPAVTEFQTCALLHLEVSDPSLPVPRVQRTRVGGHGLWHDTGADGACQLRVLSFVPGTPLTRAVPDPVQCRELGGFVVRLDQALQGFSHPLDGRRLLWDLREAGCYARLLPLVEDTEQHDLAADALHRFDAQAAPVLAALPTQVIHNDLNPHNILSAEPWRLTGVIDFGDILRAPRLQEVATACAYLVRPGPAPLAGAAAFVAGYAARSPVSPEELRLLPTLIAMRMTATLVITSWRARLQPENATYIRRNVPGALAGLRALAALGPDAAHRALTGKDAHA